MELRETSGWFGYRRSEESPTDATYSCASNTECFLPLHSVMQKIVGQMDNDLEVECRRAWFEELGKGLALASSDVKLTPADPGHVAFDLWVECRSYGSSHYSKIVLFTFNLDPIILGANS